MQPCRADYAHIASRTRCQIPLAKRRPAALLTLFLLLDPLPCRFDRQAIEATIPEGEWMRSVLAPSKGVPDLPKPPAEPEVTELE